MISHEDIAKELKVMDSKETTEDRKIDKALRPTKFDEYIGQPDLIAKLKLAVKAAKQRKEPLDHILLGGPAGLGKTSLAYIVTKEYGGEEPVVVNAPAIKDTADLIGILTGLPMCGLLFIDEIHRLNIKLEEFLHTAMEDYSVNIKSRNRITRVDLNPFCLIGATTAVGQISPPMRDRFGIVHSLQLYTSEELVKIISANAKKMNVKVDGDKALLSLAKRARGTPRIANRLLRRVRDYAQVHNGNKLTVECVDKALDLEAIDKFGLTRLDRKYLKVLMEVYQGGPVGLEAITNSMGEEKTTVQDSVEPYLLMLGFVARGKRGREITKMGSDYFDQMG